MNAIREIPIRCHGTRETYAFNQLMWVDGGTTFEWDANGSQVRRTGSEGDTEFEWDARNRLVRVSGPEGESDFGYDTRGLRVRVDETRVLLDGIEEYGQYDSGTGVKERYDHDPSRVDGLLGQVSGDGKHQFVTDALGSVYGLADGDGLAARYEYDVYGARSTKGICAHAALLRC